MAERSPVLKALSHAPNCRPAGVSGKSTARDEAEAAACVPLLLLAASAGRATETTSRQPTQQQHRVARVRFKVIVGTPITIIWFRKALSSDVTGKHQ
jgi:hypothetical protein